MGTRSIILIRERKPGRKEMSVLGGPAGSKYFYEYYACIYQHYDGYVEGGIGEWLADFLCEFIRNLPALATYANAGLLGSKLVEGFYLSEFEHLRLIPAKPLKEIFKHAYEYAYIITVSSDSDRTLYGLDDKSIMLSVYQYKDFILTARPEKFLDKYKYYMTQMEENKKSFGEISYDDDDEVDNDGYLSEDQLLIEFLNTH